MLELHILDTGYCLVSEHHLIQGGARRKVAIHAPVFLLRHSQVGWLLWDAGYAPRMLGATLRWPFWLYRLATPLRVRADQSVVAQLGRFGIGPDDVGTLFISHFHADHIGGLRDFPRTRFVATAAAYRSIAGSDGLRALRRAFIPELLPDDFAARLELLPAFSGAEIAPFGASYDYFGDGSLRLLALPGHARGQMGALLQTAHGPLLLAADGCWLSRSYREQGRPHPITRLACDDWQAVGESIGRLHQFAAANPGVRILPTHCPETLGER
jgi:glyoxylase-like metal-dependent hydrolase (beta-lactamase superfamily II)